MHWLAAAVEPALENQAIEENLRQFLLVLSVSLGVATLSRVFSILRNIPYTLLLLLVGFERILGMPGARSQLWARSRSACWRSHGHLLTDY